MKKKRIISLLLMCIMVLCTACGNKEPTTNNDTTIKTENNNKDSNIIASGDCGDQGDNVIWVLDKNWTLTISGEGRMADYGYDNPTPWETYHKETFEPESEGIAHLIVKDGVTYLGKNAFSGMGRGTECTIELANSITEIGENTFTAWYADSFTIPDSVTKIGAGAFGASGIPSIVIPDSVTEIGRKAFSNCRKLTNITISKNVKELDLSSFGECYDLITLTIPEGVEKITDGFGKGFTGSIREIYIPASVTSIYNDIYGTLGLDNVLIHTPAGSFMEQYAIEHNLTYDNNY